MTATVPAATAVSAAEIGTRHRDDERRRIAAEIDVMRIADVDELDRASDLVRGRVDHADRVVTAVDDKHGVVGDRIDGYARRIATLVRARTGNENESET